MLLLLNGWPSDGYVRFIIGGLVSTVKFRTAPAEPVFPLGSVQLIVQLCFPVPIFCTLIDFGIPDVLSVVLVSFSIPSNMIVQFVMLLELSLGVNMKVIFPLVVLFPSAGVPRDIVGGILIVKFMSWLVPFNPPPSMQLTFQNSRPSVNPLYVLFPTVPCCISTIGLCAVPFTRTVQFMKFAKLSSAVQLK